MDVSLKNDFRIGLNLPLRIHKPKSNVGIAKKLIAFLCLLLIEGLDSALVEFPSNTVVINETSPVKFCCRSSLRFELKWFLQPNDTSQRQQLSDGETILNDRALSYCDIENEGPGKFNLNLKNPKESAQTYTCQEPDTNQEASAELIIIEPTAKEKKVNDSHVILTCSVNFRGNWAPELEWSHNGTVITNGVDTNTVPNQNVTSTLALPRNGSVPDGNYTCKTRFDIRGKPQQTTDKAVPSYNTDLVLKVDEKDLYAGSGMRSSGLDGKRFSRGRAFAVLAGFFLPVMFRYSSSPFDTYD